MYTTLGLFDMNIIIPLTVLAIIKKSRTQSTKSPVANLRITLCRNQLRNEHD